MTPEELQKMPAEISELMAERLGIRGKILAPKIRRAGRLIPKKVRLAAEQLADAEKKLQNPKLLKQIDEDSLAQSYYLCRIHLEGINRAATKSNKRADLLSSIAFNLLFLFILVTALVLWRGLI